MSQRSSRPSRLPDARDLLAEPDGTDREDRNEAEVWLEDYLTEHGRTAGKDVKNDARKAGIAERTLKRAAKDLNVVYTTEGFPRTTSWALPPQSGQGQQSDLTHGPTGPTGPTGSDLHKQVGPTGVESQSGHAPVNGPTAKPTVFDTPGAPQVRTPDRRPGQWLASGTPIGDPAA